MKLAYPLRLSLAFCAICASLSAQNFVNGDLNGTFTNPSTLPTSWQSVPYTDINCLATGSDQATPDLTNVTMAPFGFSGTPYSGSTCVTGLHGGVGVVYQEGIMQTVPGFVPGQPYTIYFYQAVVKQNNGLDTSGSWAVYIDNALAGITPPAYNSAPYNSNNSPWYPVSVTFTASSPSHTIKFLPLDDDANQTMSPQDINGGLRMGIDLIYVNNMPVGLEEMQQEGHVSFYPNPFQQSATLQFSNPGNENCTLTLYNYSGQLVRSHENLKGGVVTIEKNDLGPGIYFLVLEAPDRLIAKRRFSIE